MTHRDGFPRLSARSAWRGDAGHRKPCATQPESLGKPPPVGQANRRRASESLDDVPHRPRLPSYPADRLPDLYGSLSTLLGISGCAIIISRRSSVYCALRGSCDEVHVPSEKSHQLLPGSSVPACHNADCGKLGRDPAKESGRTAVDRGNQALGFMRWGCAGANPGILLFER